MSNCPLSVTFLSLLLLAALLATCLPLRDIPASVSVLDTGQQPGASTSKRSTAFVPNPEQTNPALLFRTLGAAGTLFFGRHEVVFPLPSSNHTAALFSGLSEASTSDLAMSTEPTTLRLRFVGGNPDTHVVGEERLPGIVNYFIGNDPAKWHTNIPTYGSIVYERLYPGIDLFYSDGEGFLKGTFVVAPGANPGDIRWRYDGASRVESSKGELLISVAENDKAASLIERKPVAWQTVAGKRSPVDVRYVIHGDGSIGFALGRYDATQPLIIDPTLDYSTYFGGSGFDGSAGIAVDCNNYVYIGGVTDSPDFPDPGTIAGDRDVFVTKLDLSQTGAKQLVYTTYVGGADRERVLGIEVDCSGKAHVIGYTESNDFPTTANAFQRDFNGFFDGIVVQLDAAGAIHYVSYLGGTDFEELVQVAVGDNGLMYVVGYTDSPDFPTTDNAFQKANAGEADALMAVLDPSKSGDASLVYSTYYGGSEFDEGYAIDVSDGIIYFAGHSPSDNLSLENPIQPVNNGGGWSGDAFIAKIDPSQPPDDQLLFATYLGGTAGEVSGGVAVDASGNVYWGGTTGSADFPSTAISPPYGGGDWDAFLVKLDTTIPSLIYSRLVGGSGDDGIRHIVLDGSGNAYVTGGTGSDDFPTVNPIQDTYKGGVATVPELEWYGPGDVMVAKFDTTGAMTFGTYLSGTGAEAGMGIVLDTLGNVYVAGGTESTDLEIVDPFRDTNAGGFDVFIASIGGLAPPTVDLSIGKLAGRDAIIAGEQITYTITITNAGPTTPITATVVDTFGDPAALAGVTSDDGCAWTPGSAVVTCTVPGVAANVPVSLTLIVTTSVTYAGVLSNTAVVAPTGVVTDTNPANNRAGPVEVTLYEPVEADFTGWPTSGVAPLTVVFTNTSSGDYTTSLWDFGDGVTGTLESPTHTYIAAGIYTVTLTVSGPGGSDTETKAEYISVKHAVYLPLVLSSVEGLVVRASGGVAEAPPLPPRSVNWWPRGRCP